MAHPTSACQIIIFESIVTWHFMIFANDSHAESIPRTDQRFTVIYALRWGL